jgi:tRNA(Arg) A34 adenosine deaminase TadA
MKNKFLELAIKIAKKNNNKPYNFVAIIVDRKNRIRSIGLNSYRKTHPLQKKYADIVGMPDREFLHAEIHAIVSLQDFSLTDIYTIYIARVNKQGKIMPAQPCPICRKALGDYFIDNIITT